MPKAFISYVHENSEDVQKLAKELRKDGIRVWLDKNDIKPGSRWKDAIREAISQGDFFIACFSSEYSERSKTFMNEELTLAVEELRQRPTDRAWFIPVLLSDTSIPNRSISAGETLHDIQRVDLYRDWNDGIKRILSVMQPASARVPEESITQPDPKPPWPAGSLPMCIEMELPSLIRTDPKYWPRNVPPEDAGPFFYARTWPGGVWLRVRFMDGTPDIQEAVRSLAEEWVSATSYWIHFAFGDYPEAEIRISFSTEYLWSYVGTDALFVPPEKPTLCLGAIAVETDYETIRKAVLHEFGHVLGLIHTPQYVYEGECAHLGKGFDNYFMAAVKGHFRSEIHQNNVRDLVRKQSFRLTREDLAKDSQAIMHAHVPAGYANNRSGDDTFVDVWKMSNTISPSERQLLEQLLRNRSLGYFNSHNPFDLLTSEPPGSVSKSNAS